ncbi:photosynthetic NDH subunit of subcomplex B 3, chloroplastic isoform X1 [Lotus japonicus]|uniref:2Fe-2S ferredoxin-type domain-containing protein n=1 Tax=Lotus japonicus TaxID=34305 RepID=I3SQH3_LOTJA|nr:photosynthetic NDH subunit of subcomplex B 3, chloroplastic isoform X1 [Lotus japonicus]XP_057451479.1 photosynthetic NDH subunit of subcomplex B 3, chloroplastic isoform X1 [Lotus japonicus]AFK42515.1 unknown [Lotus japonicus]
MSLLQLQLTSHALCSLPSFSNSFRPNRTFHCSKRLNFATTNIRAVGTVPERDLETTATDEPPSVGFAFVSSVLLPDGTPDIHYRSATGGQKLRDIMLDSNIELYGPYGKLFSNCAGGGTCATCMVEVLEGTELLNPRTDKEKEKLKRKPKNWRLACQTTVGEPDSTGVVVIQQLPEWKGHEWKYEKPEESAEESL